MTTLNITDFNAFIKNQIHQHENLAEQLLQLRHVIGFTANSDLAQANPAELHTQLTIIDKLLEEALASHQKLQAELLRYRISQTLKAEQLSDI